MTRCVVQDGENISIEVPNLSLAAFWPAAYYILHRWPAPELLPGDVQQRSVLISLTHELLTANRVTKDFDLKETGAFVLGSTPSILDVAFCSIKSDKTFVKQLTERLDEFERILRDKYNTA